MAKKKVERWDLDRVMVELEKMGNPQQVKTYRRHGADGEMFGVRIADLKRIIKHISGDQELALALWDTNNSDAMYLASLVVDGSKMNRRQLDHWVKTAWWSMLSEHCVPSVAAEHSDAFAIAMKWMTRKQDSVVSSGWCTYSAALSVRSDQDIDKREVKTLLTRVKKEIHDAPNRVRHSMNHFIIAVGCYYPPLLRQAKETAKAVGIVNVDMGGTACKVPLATEYIEKVEKMGRVGKKRESTKC